MTYFEKFCPLTQFIYFCMVLSMFMFFQNPIILLIALISALISCVFILRSIKISDVEFLILTILLCTLLNPLLSHNGVHVLFFLNSKAVTVEALLYGANFGLLLATVILWFKIFSKVFGSDRFLSLFASKLPKTSMIISVALRFIPLFTERYKNIRAYSAPMEKNKEKSHLQSFSALISWAFEASLQCSDSMSARGYGTGKRSHYTPYKFRFRDFIFTVFVVLLSLITIIAIASGKINYEFYPQFQIEQITPFSVISYISYAILCFFPLSVEMIFRTKQKNSRKRRVCFNNGNTENRKAEF